MSMSLSKDATMTSPWPEQRPSPTESQRAQLSIVRAPVEPVRLLVIGHSYMTRFAQAKYEALTRLHADVSVQAIVPSRWSGLREFTAEERDDERFRVTALPVAFQRWGSRYVFTSPRLISLLREFRPNVVQVEHEPVALALLQLNILVAALRQRPKIVLFSWEDIRASRKPAMALASRAIERFNVSRLSHTIPGNDDAIGVLRSKGFRGPMTQLPQVGIDPEEFSPGREDALRAELGLGESFVFGFAGRIVREKGMLTLAEALTRMGERDWKLLLVGAGDALADVRRELDGAGLGDRLRHVPTVPHPEMPPYYRCMDAFVLASETTPKWKEQFGHVLLQAMACGVPIVASSSGYIPKVVGDAGLIFEEQDLDALAGALAKMMDDPELRETLVGRGHAAVSERYSHDAVAERLYAVYREVIDG
jgi:glycosyltransferase involved in cell wall biosynthesis